MADRLVTSPSALTAYRRSRGKRLTTPWPLGPLAPIDLTSLVGAWRSSIATRLMYADSGGRRLLGQWQEFPATLGVGEAETSSDPEVVRRVFCALDEAIYHLDSVSEPCSVHLEVRLSGTVVEDRLRQAVGVALARHPRARARATMARQRRAGYEWEITPAPDVDPLDVVVCSDDDALQAVRADLQSLAVPLATSPPLRIRLARHRSGDVVMLNLHHAAGDGIAALGLLRSIARAYAGRCDPVSQTPPEELKIPAPSGRWAQLRALMGELRQAAPRSAHLIPIGGEDRPGYWLYHLVLDTAQTAALVATAEGGPRSTTSCWQVCIWPWTAGTASTAAFPVDSACSCRSTCAPRHLGMSCSATSPTWCPSSPVPKTEPTPPPQSRRSAVGPGASRTPALPPQSSSSSTSSSTCRCRLSGALPASPLPSG